MREFPPPPRPTPPPPRPAYATTTASVTLLGSPPVFEQLLDERTVLIDGAVDDAMAHRVVAQLLLLAARDPRRDIALYVHSEGGSAVAGLAIHDTMQLVAPDVATCAVGVAASVGQMLVTAGATGKRTALPHARLRLRRPPGRDADLAGALAAVTAARTGHPVEQVVADSAENRWFTAAQAVDYGLVDAVRGAAGG